MLIESVLKDQLEQIEEVNDDYETPPKPSPPVQNIVTSELDEPAPTEELQTKPSNQSLHQSVSNFQLPQNSKTEAEESDPKPMAQVPPQQSSAAGQDIHEEPSVDLPEDKVNGAAGAAPQQKLISS